MLIGTGVHFSVDNLIWTPRNPLASSLLHIFISDYNKLPFRSTNLALQARIHTLFIRTYEHGSNQKSGPELESHRNNMYANYSNAITISCHLTSATQLAQTPNFTFTSTDCFQSNRSIALQQSAQRKTQQRKSKLPKSSFSGHSHKIFDNKLQLVGMVIGESLLTRKEKKKNRERVRMLLEAVCSDSIITNSFQEPNKN